MFSKWLITDALLIVISIILLNTLLFGLYGKFIYNICFNTSSHPILFTQNKIYILTQFNARSLD